MNILLAVEEIEVSPGRKILYSEKLFYYKIIEELFMHDLECSMEFLRSPNYMKKFLINFHFYCTHNKLFGVYVITNVFHLLLGRWLLTVENLVLFWFIVHQISYNVRQFCTTYWACNSSTMFRWTWTKRTTSCLFPRCSRIMLRRKSVLPPCQVSSIPLKSQRM